jgi:surfactin synthase thioesterase subunit
MADRELPAGARRALIRFAAAGTPRRRLICLPFAGGGPSTYRWWPRSLPADMEVLAVVLPGRDPRVRAAGGEDPPGAMAAVVPPVVEAIDELQDDSPLPFAIFGHSMGALVAFELTVALEAAHGAHAPAGAGSRDRVPGHLFVSGRRPPDELHRGDPIHGLPNDRFLDEMQRLYGGVPEVVRSEPELLALFLPALRADVRVFETYAPLTDRQVQCPVSVYGGADDRRPTPAQLPGWQRVVARQISLRTFPGDHFYLNDHRDDLAADIASRWTVMG